jgi:hypothetical protein
LKNLTEYLKTEFHVYPRAFRDIANFLTKDDVSKKILGPELAVCCNDCEQASLTVNEINTKNSIRYSVSCKCGRAGPLKASKAEAAWGWNSMKGTPALGTRNPLVNAERYEKMMAKLTTEKSILAWLGAINLHKKVWLAHRDTSEYQNLSIAEQSFVEVIGLLNGLLKKEAVAMLQDAGASLMNDETQLLLAAEELSIARERKLAYPKFKDLLPVGFHSKVRDIIGA